MGAAGVALSEEEAADMAVLQEDLDTSRTAYERLDAYYEGTWRLERLGLAVPPELEQFVTLVNWPRVTAGEVERRCDVEGFRLPGSEEVGEDLQVMWQANDLDEASQLGHLDSMVLGRAYTCIGTREDDEPSAGIPLISTESALDITHASDTRTRRVRVAYRVTSETERTLYYPNETIWLESAGKDWNDVERDQHNLGVVPVVPMLNHGRLRNAKGVSEMADVLSLTDAAARALTNAQVATEVLAVPQRYVLGAAPKDFVDKEGKPLPAWDAYFGAVWALQNGDAKVGQFSAADLSNFANIVNHYAALVSGVSGLPTRFYGISTANPPSEGSIVADETRLIMNAYRKHRALGGAWRRTMRIATMIADGSNAENVNPELTRIETMWRNPETPTRAQTADAVVKLHGVGILPTEAAWEELGYSRTRRVELAEMRRRELEENPLAAAASAFAGGGAAGGGTAGGDPAAAGTAADPAQPEPVGVGVADAEV